MRTVVESGGRRRWFLRPMLVVLAALAIGGASSAAALEVRLYILDGGRLDIPDMGTFSDTGEHEGERGTLAVPCFLVQHGDDWLLWDTGLGDDLLAKAGGGEVRFGMRFAVQTTLAAQLARLGLKPDDVRYVALSHLHADHSGNVGLFPHATFLVSPLELTWAGGKQLTDALLNGGVVPDSLFRLALEKVGLDGVNRVVFQVGLYHLVSMTLSSFDVPAPS